MQALFILTASLLAAGTLWLFGEQLTFTHPNSTHARLLSFAYFAFAAFQLVCACLVRSPRRWPWCGAVLSLLTLGIVCVVSIVQAEHSGAISSGGPGANSMAGVVILGELVAAGFALISAVLLIWLIRIRTRVSPPRNA